MPGDTITESVFYHAIHGQTQKSYVPALLHHPKRPFRIELVPFPPGAFPFPFGHFHIIFSFVARAPKLAFADLELAAVLVLPQPVFHFLPFLSVRARPEPGAFVQLVPVQLVVSNAQPHAGFGFCPVLFLERCGAKGTGGNKC